MVSCGCYKCTSPVYAYDDEGRRHVVNNLHARLVPCSECGRPRSEYVDHGTFGEHRCWWCETRTATLDEVPPATEPTSV